MKQTILKHSYSGKSLLELREKYGLGGLGFWDNNWWLTEPFAQEHAEPGEYEIILDNNSVYKTYDEQVKKIKKGFEVAHPAVIVEAVLEYYKKNGKRLLEDWYVRTNTFTSVGARVYVGEFDGTGLGVADARWDGVRDDDLALASARKLGNPKPCELESFESLNTRLLVVENFISNLKKL